MIHIPEDIFEEKAKQLIAGHERSFHFFLDRMNLKA